MRALKLKLATLTMGKLWTMWRSQLDEGAIAGSGGILLLGDSITHSGRWELIFPDLPIRNFGISGERTEHLLTRLEPIIRIQPSKLFLLIGTNDLGVETEIDVIVANVAALFDQLSRALPQCTMYLQTVMPRAGKYAGRIRALNRRYAELAAKRGIELIDLFPLFDDGNGAIRQELTNDDLHLMGAGYRVWRDALVPHVLPVR